MTRLIALLSFLVAGGFFCGSLAGGNSVCDAALVAGAAAFGAAFGLVALSVVARLLDGDL